MNYVEYSPMCPFFSPKQVAEILGVSKKKLERMRKDGSGPKFRRLSARTIQYHGKDLNEWIAAKPGQD